MISVDRNVLGTTAFLLPLLVAPVAGCKTSKAASATPPDPPVTVETVVVREASIPKTMGLTGSLKGRRETDLAANASGRVTQTYVERGAEVAAGALLAQLDVRGATLSAAEAKANTESAKVQADNAKAECTRADGLYQKGALTRQEYERLSSQCLSTQQGVAAAQARAVLAAKTVGDGAIRAPFAGLVTERYVNVGEYVRDDSRVVTLVDVDPLRLEFTVPEANLPTVKSGTELAFTVAAFPGRRFHGTVRFVGGAVRAATRDAVAEAEVSNRSRELRSGMFAAVDLPIGELTAAIVPKNALVERSGRSHVFVVHEGRLEERVAQAGPPVGENEQAIVRGLHAGDRVVVHPAETLRNGQTVR